ncbi:MAG TPA: site-specific integrase [Bryobacteraceae bacterium]|nr:site-specific integrase [Bryobacteraceae bacterium]
MAIYKRGGVYWYVFRFKGERIRETTRQGNANVARQIESARLTELAKGEVGIIDKPKVPTFKEFAPRFEKAIETLCKDKPATIDFYKERLRRLLEYAPLVSRRLDTIDEQVIEALKLHRTRQVSRFGRPLSVASINRELATLRRLLRLAQEWKVIDRLPRIRLFRGEVNREFVLGYELENQYLHMAPQPLKDVALLMLDTGARPGEACALAWSNVRLEPADGSKFGYIHIAGGKSKNATRNLSLTERVREMLVRRKASKEDLVFPGDTGLPFLVSSLDHQHNEFRALLGMPADFVIHSLRHTMLTRLGEAGADAFTIMRIAGHSSVTVSQRYVHPSPESLETAFERLDALNQSKRSEASGQATKTATAVNRRATIKASKQQAVNKMGA